jgi:hypothetical protein
MEKHRIGDLTDRRTQGRSLLVLALVCATCLALVGLLAWRYSYSASTLLAAAAAAAVLVATLAFVLLVQLRVQPSSPVIRRATAAGLWLGLVWTIEIAMNNLLAPPLPARDIIDDVFWVVVALGILACAVIAARRGAVLADGLRTGLWAGIASGAVACLTALVMVDFAMRFMTADPLNQREWAAAVGHTTAPDIASYFAFETLAGAIAHLVVLGAGMGLLLGLVGGVVGRPWRAGGARRQR